MFSDYSVTSINMYSPSGKRSPKNQAALVLPESKALMLKIKGKLLLQI